MHLDFSVNVLNVATAVPTLLVAMRIYSGWKIIEYRLGLMWIDYCKEHNLPTDTKSIILP